MTPIRVFLCVIGNSALVESFKIEYNKLTKPAALRGISFGGITLKENYKMTIAYDGSRYFGWEHQPNTDLTIQGKLESVLSLMTGTEVEVIGAGRTDAGVHAKGMVANAHFETDQTTEEICQYMNRYLPEDICVTEVWPLTVSTAVTMRWGKRIVTPAMQGI